jgi:NhaP-type Na+/H+ and K+/H+ antiporter
MKHLIEGLGMMVASIIVFLIIGNFVQSSVIKGTDVGSMLVKSLMLLVVAAVVIFVPVIIMVKMWSKSNLS